MTSVNATTLVEEEQNQANLARKRDLKNAGAAAALSVRRLNVMRIGYAVMGVGS